MKNKLLVKEITTIIIGLILFATYLLLFHFVFNERSFCIVKFITTMPCPTCGLSRAYIKFFSFDIKGAFYYHPLFWLFPILFLIFAFRKRRICSKIFYSWKFWLIVMLLIFIVYLFRLFLVFPNDPSF